MSFLPLAVSSTLVSFLWPRRRATFSESRQCLWPPDHLQQLRRGLAGAREQPLRHGLAGARDQPVRRGLAGTRASSSYAASSRAGT